MKGLLCAIMIGTRCISWHPAGTKKEDIVEYGQIGLDCVFFGGCKPVSFPKNGNRTLNCVDVEDGELVRLINVNYFNINKGFTYSCTKKQWLKRQENFRLKQVLEIERQNDGAVTK